jgi:4'-phosphopantetheinyl transferase
MLAKSLKISDNICYYIINTNSKTNIDTAILSDLELQRFNRFRRKEDALAFYSGRQILYQYQQKFNAKNIRQIQIGEYGKPFIKSNPFYFNISHSGTCVVVAFSIYNEVGIDIEQTPKLPKQELLKMSEIVFAESEIAQLQQLSAKAGREYFTRLWVLKESYIKLMGKGFYINTKEIIFKNVDSLNPSLISTSDLKIHFELRNWKDDFYICVAGHFG